VEEVKQFPAIDRRRSVAVPYEQREAGDVVRSAAPVVGNAEVELVSPTT